MQLNFVYYIGNLINIGSGQVGRFSKVDHLTDSAERPFGILKRTVIPTPSLWPLKSHKATGHQV